MFDYYFAEATEDPDPDRPEPLVIRVLSLNEATLRLLPAYLLETYAARLDLRGLDTHLGARPIVLEIDGGARFSERAIWSLVVELPDAADYVVSYVQHVLAETESGEDLPFCTSLNVVGQEPLYAYFERFIRSYELTEDGDISSHFRVVDMFLAFLRRCDMDHETFQDDYVQLVLTFLYWRNISRLVDLLHFRLTVGQFCEGRLEYVRYLTSNGAFKQIVDRQLRLEGGLSLRWLLELCALIYGSDAQSTSAVIDYCRRRVDLADGRASKKFEDYLRYLRAQGQAYLERYSRSADTGFHIRNEGSGTWDWVLNEA